MLWVFFWNILVWCGQGATETEEKEEVKSEKSILQISTQKLASLDSNPNLIKTGRLVWASDIAVTSQTSGRVSSISFSEGDSLLKWATVVVLADSGNLYTYPTKRLKESLDSTRLNYVSSKVDIDNQLIDLELSVQQAEYQLDVAKEDAEQQRRDTEQQLLDAEIQLLDVEQQLKDAEQQRELAEYNARTNNVDGSSWSAALQLQKFDSDIEKAEFDYETKLTADDQALEGFVNSSQRIVDSVTSLQVDVIDTVDRLLWISTLNRSLNDSFENYLWAKNTQTYRDAVDDYLSVVRQKQDLESTNLYIAEVEEVSEVLWRLDEYLSGLTVVLNSTERVLQNSVTWSEFSQVQLDGYVAQINWFQSQVLNQWISITQQVNSIDAFLRTYKQNQESLLKNVNLLKEQRDILEKQLRDASISSDIGSDRADIWWERIKLAKKRTEIQAARTEIGLKRADIQAQNTVKNAEINLQSRKNALEALSKTRENTLASLQNSIDQAQVSYNESLANVSKLTITTPISWSISNIYVDVWTEVNPGTRIFDITTTSEQEVNLTFSSDEKGLIEEWKEVEVVIGNKVYAGVLTSISDVADQNLLYKGVVTLTELSGTVWEVAEVRIPLESTYPLLPLNVIQMKTTKEWDIWIYNWWKAEKMSITLWEVWDDMIEVTSSLSSGMEIITSPMDQYDPNTIELQFRDEERENKKVAPSKKDEDSEQKDDQKEGWEETP